MSLILEALRKSEAERRRAQAPDLFAEPQLALPRARSAWPQSRWFALGALGVVALIATVLLVRAMWLPAAPAGVARSAIPEPAPAAPDVATTPAPSSTPRAAAATAPAALPAARPPAADPAPVSVPSMPPGPTAAVVVAPPPARATPEPVAAAPVGVAVPVGAADAPVDTGTQRLADLGTEQRQQLPPLKLSMHMWDDAPAQRFVILDGQRLGEGDRIGDAVVEQITRDGAILAWNGRRLRVGLR